MNNYSKIAALYSRMIGNFLFRLLYLLGKILSLLSLEKSRCFVNPRYESRIRRSVPFLPCRIVGFDSFLSQIVPADFLCQQVWSYVKVSYKLK